MRPVPSLIAFHLIAALAAADAIAQPQDRPVDETTISQTRMFDRGKNFWSFEGDVEMESGDAKIYADAIAYWVNEDRIEASGNVSFSQTNTQINADRVVFNTKTRLGTFYHASGFASVQPPRQATGPGTVAVPQLLGQDTDVYFFGEEVQKIGSKKYRIKNGGFSTCVQPTPRWDLSAGTIDLNVDDYTLLRQAIFKVKGVPLLYVPILYYPTQEEGRATGFLLPNYSGTTLRGQSIQVPFFWAINRSHDATVAYEWFSKGGRGLESQYRYNMGLGSDGNVRLRTLDQPEILYLLPDGTTNALAASQSFEVRGGANQRLTRALYARGRVDYFSSVETMQQFNTNLLDASRSQRSFGGNVVGVWRTYSMNATFDRNENFYNTTDSVVNGGAPRVSVSRNERPLAGGAYFSANSEFVHLIRQTHQGDVTTDSGLSRLDFLPQVRFPFKRWQWFTVNSSASWRQTFYSRSYGLDPATGEPTSRIVEDGVSRQYFTVQAQAVGPILNRIWDTPNSGYAERIKHSIEPFFNATRTSSIDNFSRIVQSDGVDGVVGNSTNLTYGVNSRVYAKRRVGTVTSQAQEIVNVSLSQTYYTDPRSAQFDRQYATSTFGSDCLLIPGTCQPPSHFSPLLLGVRVTPSREIEGRLNAEFDSRYRQLRTLSAGGSYNLSSRLQASASWSQKYFIQELPGWNDPLYLDHYLNASFNARTTDNRFGGLYSFNYNILRSSLLQQRMTAFYNAQCCGIAFDYQTYHFNYGPSVPADHRFFLSFTLAGLGNFAPFSGAMTGVPR
jgi:LPS-assembly protein